MIIECPSCKTKFSLTDSQVSAPDNPRFHCSRCDHVFNLRTHHGQPQPGQENHSLGLHGETSLGGAGISHSSAIDAFSIGDPEFDKPTSWAEQLELLPKVRTPEKTSLTPDVVKGFSDLLEGGDCPPITAQWPSNTHTEPLAADMTEVLRRHFSEDTLPRANLLRRPDRFFKSLRNPLARRHHEEATLAGTQSVVEETQTALEFKPFTDEQLAELEGNFSTELASKHSASAYPKANFAPLSDGSAEEDEDELLSGEVLHFPKRQATYVFDDEEPFVMGSRSTPLAQERTNKVTTSPMSLTGEQSIGAFVMPIVLFISIPMICAVGLFWTTNALAAKPAVASNLFSLVQDEPVIIPPPGVELTDISSRLVSLDDGKLVVDVHGEIRNNSPLPIKDVRIEAQLYSADNQPLRHIFVPARNGLLKTQRINSLPESSLDKLQDEPALGVGKIAPTERSEFRLVITDASEKAAWISARVHSVRKTQLDQPSSAG